MVNVKGENPLLDSEEQEDENLDKQRDAEEEEEEEEKIILEPIDKKEKIYGEIKVPFDARGLK